MKKHRMKRVVSICLVIMLLLTGMCQPIKNVMASDKQVVYISVEKFTIGQGYIVEPKVLEISSGEKVSSVLTRLLAQEGIEPDVEENTSYGWYLAGIKNVDTGNGHVPKCIQQMGDDTPTDSDLIPAQEKNINYPDLSQFSYSQLSGWCYFVNNVAPSVGLGNWTAKDGDVIRVRFTLYGAGIDLGNGWPGSLDLPNLDAITKRMAVFNQYRNLCFNKGYQTAYREAVAVVADMDSTEAQINEVYNKLPSETQILAWAKENEVEKANQAAAQAVINKINAISSSVTLENESQINAARAAYNALSEAQKALVSSNVVTKLTQAEQKIVKLKEEKALADKAAKEAAEKAAKEEAERIALEKQQAAEQAAKKQQAADKAAAQSVISKIKAIGTVSLSKESKIKAARKAYNALTTAQKAYVTNLKTLTNAEKKLSELKKYTPKKTTLKTVKKSGNNKMKLTWKKISGCTGYQIYMSNKKSSGYKKVATIKKNKTISYTKTKLKKGKTYYFKIRTYKKVGKTTYYGSYSNMKKLKMK